MCAHQKKSKKRSTKNWRINSNRSQGPRNRDYIYLLLEDFETDRGIKNMSMISVFRDEQIRLMENQYRSIVNATKNATGLTKKADLTKEKIIQQALGVSPTNQTVGQFFHDLEQAAKKDLNNNTFVTTGKVLDGVGKSYHNVKVSDITTENVDDILKQMSQDLNTAVDEMGRFIVVDCQDIAKNVLANSGSSIINDAMVEKVKTEIAKTHSGNVYTVNQPSQTEDQILAEYLKLQALLSELNTQSKSPNVNKQDLAAQMLSGIRVTFNRAAGLFGELATTGFLEEAIRQGTNTINKALVFNTGDGSIQYMISQIDNNYGSGRYNQKRAKKKASQKKNDVTLICDPGGGKYVLDFGFSVKQTWATSKITNNNKETVLAPSSITIDSSARTLGSLSKEFLNQKNGNPDVVTLSQIGFGSNGNEQKLKSWLSQSLTTFTVANLKRYMFGSGKMGDNSILFVVNGKIWTMVEIFESMLAKVKETSNMGLVTVFKTATAANRLRTSNASLRSKIINNTRSDLDLAAERSKKLLAAYNAANAGAVKLDMSKLKDLF